MRYPRRRALIIGLAAVAACANGPGALGADAHGERAIQTDRLEYAVEYSQYRVEVSIPFTYRNRTRGPVYVSGCHGPHPPALEKRVDGAWVRAYNPIVFLCLGPPTVIEPGHTYDSALRVAAGLPGNNHEPKFEVAQIPGTYRLVWLVYAGRFWRDGESALDYVLPLEERISNEFVITEPAP